MKGFNGTVFAYGQTSSGKTRTLMGDGQDGDHPGVTILAIRDIFEYIKKNPSVEWHVTCCYMEIYNEIIKQHHHIEPMNLSIQCQITGAKTKLSNDKLGIKSQHSFSQDIELKDKNTVSEENNDA